MKTKISLLQYFVMLIIIASCGYSSAIFSKEPARVIAGWVEKVRIENLDFEVKAKLDTGAKTSSIHAINIRGFKKGDERWVKFTLVLVDSRDKKYTKDFEMPRSRRTRIKNHDGIHDKRYVVDLHICFNGRTYLTEFTLADRREYIYDVLLGRQFLKKAAIVDPKNTFLTLAECE